MLGREKKSVFDKGTAPRIWDNNEYVVRRTGPSRHTKILAHTRSSYGGVRHTPPDAVRIIRARRARNTPLSFLDKLDKSSTVQYTTCRTRDLSDERNSFHVQLLGHREDTCSSNYSCTVQVTTKGDRVALDLIIVSYFM